MLHTILAKRSVNNVTQSWLQRATHNLIVNPDSTYVIYIRHGESEWNVTKQYAGQMEVHLTEKGRKDAWHAGYRLAMFCSNADLKIRDIEFYSSDQIRARKTGEIIMSRLTLDPQKLIKSSLLREKSVGAFTGCYKDEKNRPIVDSADLDIAPPDMQYDHPLYFEVSEQARKGESHRNVMDRTDKFYEDILLPNLKEHKNTVIASHSNTGAAFFRSMSGGTNRKVPFMNCVPLVFQFNKEQIIEDIFYLNRLGRTAEYTWFEKDKVEPKRFTEEFLERAERDTMIGRA